MHGKQGEKRQCKSRGYVRREQRAKEHRGDSREQRQGQGRQIVLETMLYGDLCSAINMLLIVTLLLF
jgi:hypothetical protein